MLVSSAAAGHVGIAQVLGSMPTSAVISAEGRRAARVQPEPDTVMVGCLHGGSLCRARIRPKRPTVPCPM
jgi:hypothetical protein